MLHADATITLDSGAYRLHEQLASSAYGLVWRARRSKGGADVALKFINAPQMARARSDLQIRWRASAEREIAFLRSLEPWDERHIVRLLDAGTHDGLPVLALELMGRDLGRHVATERAAGRPIPVEQALDWLAQVNQALAKVHQYGWRYLDLKPANVLQQLHGNAVKLADFGTSELLSGSAAPVYTGTASWQAPEQFFPTAHGTYDTDARTDYFALGAMLYYLVTGGLPLRFCSDCGQAYRAQQAAGAATLLARHGGVLPPTLRDDEAALFTHRIARQLNDTPDATWCPAADSGAAAAALALLRSLLAAQRADRPQNSLQISRMIAAARPPRLHAYESSMAPRFRPAFAGPRLRGQA